METKPSEYYDVPDEWRRKKTFQEQKIDRKGIDQTLVDNLMNGYSHVMRGKDVSESFTTETSPINEMLENVAWEQIPGDTPLKKGANYASALAKAAERTGKDASKMNSDPKTAKELAEEANEIIRKVGGTVGGDPGLAEITGVHTEGMYHNMDEAQLAMLEALSKISEMKQLPASKVNRKLILDPNGAMEIQRPAKGPDEFYDHADTLDFLLDKVGLALPQGDFMVNDRMSYKDMEQVVCFFYDISGSMQRPKEKIPWVRAILSHYMNLAAQGKIKFYTSGFEQKIERVVRIDDMAGAKEYFKTVTDQVFRGGGTDVEGVIKYAQKRIKDGMIGSYTLPVGCAPEIIICNDGADMVRVEKYEAPVHTIILGETNKNLQKNCIMSGGSYTELLKVEEDYW